MSSENKVTVFAPLIIDEAITEQAREKAAVLAFPEEKQNDLQYMRSILVSAGTNKNGAHFLPSEMLNAHNTVVNKAIDIEHDEQRVIGHIYECAFLFKDGQQFDPKKLLADYQETSQDVDDLDIDILAAGVIHKMRFPELADEVSNGDWKVSMECFFKDFDIKIGNTIITRNEAETLGYNPHQLIGGFVKVTAGQQELGKQFVARVLRSITFSGMGIVKNPANPHSIILETAAMKEMQERNEVVVDLERIDNMRGHMVELSSSDEEVNETDLTKVTAMEDGEAEEIYVELDSETGGVKRVFTKETAAVPAGKLRFTGNGIGGPGSVLSFPDSVCKSFKKRVTKFNALDQSEAQVVHEHWCALFEEACPVIGASSKAPECLRNVRNRTTRDEGDNTLTKTVREHVDQGPGNTFTTTLKKNVASAEKLAERQEQIARVREQARSLRGSLQKYVEVSTEKKTSK